MMRSVTTTVSAMIVLAWVGAIVLAQDEPELPAGLGSASPEDPALPAGLGAPEEPALPTGLSPAPDEETPALGDEEESAGLPFDLTGFWEFRAGTRTSSDAFEKEMSIGETRLQLEIQKQWTELTLNVTADFLFDPVLDRHGIDLDAGEGWLDLRQANVVMSPLSFIDVKIGRQILTWGTGDLVFINDLFPKDWNAFFIGRDVEYLKAPSDAIKVSLFSDLANLDIVYVPLFDADRFIDGRRISFFSPAAGGRVGRNAVVVTDPRSEYFTEDEIAWRLFKNVKGFELALYGYHGYWKSPGGMKPSAPVATFPRLAVYGASARGAVGKGIGNIEVGYYDSKDDRGGGNPLVRNSEARFLIGYEQEIAKNLTAGVQYYLEHLMDHGALKGTLPPGVATPDENRHVLTLRLTKLLSNQNLKLSLFAFYSPSDQDAYLRPAVHYQVDDHWSVFAGASIFFGEESHTFFNQFARNSNVYVGARFGF